MQLMDQKTPPEDPKTILEEIRIKMQTEQEKQLVGQGYYNPWEHINLVIAKQKTFSERYP